MYFDSIWVTGGRNNTLDEPAKICWPLPCRNKHADGICHRTESPNVNSKFFSCQFLKCVFKEIRTAEITRFQSEGNFRIAEADRPRYTRVDFGANPQAANPKLADNGAGGFTAGDNRLMHARLNQAVSHTRQSLLHYIASCFAPKFGLA